MAMTSEERIKYLEDRVNQLADRVRQLEGHVVPIMRFGSPAYPDTAMPIPTESRCLICGVRDKDRTGYVCSNPRCQGNITC
jgi:hypothetical protein